MNRKSLLAAVLVATLATTMSVTVFAAESKAQDEEAIIRSISEKLNNLRLTLSAEIPAGLVPAKLIGEELAAYTDKVFEIANREREKVGAAPLERNRYLDEAANTRAMDCVSVNSLYIGSKPHIRPDESRWFTVLGIDKNYNYGENAGQGGSTADVRMASWMGSAGHKANILREDYTEIGIGCAVSEQGEIFAVQIFYRP